MERGGKVAGFWGSKKGWFLGNFGVRSFSSYDRLENDLDIVMKILRYKKNCMIFGLVIDVIWKIILFSI